MLWLITTDIGNNRDKIVMYWKMTIGAILLRTSSWRKGEITWDQPHHSERRSPPRQEATSNPTALQEEWAGCIQRLERSGVKHISREGVLNKMREGDRDEIACSLKAQVRNLDFIFNAMESHWKIISRGLLWSDLQFTRLTFNGPWAHDAFVWTEIISLPSSWALRAPSVEKSLTTAWYMYEADKCEKITGPLLNNEQAMWPCDPTQPFVTSLGVHSRIRVLEVIVKDFV